MAKRVSMTLHHVDVSSFDTVAASGHSGVDGVFDFSGWDGWRRVDGVATKKLSRSDRFAVDAATGWIMLGNADEAWAELEKVSETGRRVPEVLELEWSIYAARKEWQAALGVAEVLIKVAPRKSFGWVHKAYALRRVQAGNLEAAEAVLIEAARRFPREPIIPFNLACYAAQLGKLSEAKEWLHQAMEAAGNVEEIVRMAKADEDLAPLADYLETL